MVDDIQHMYSQGSVCTTFTFGENCVCHFGRSESTAVFFVRKTIIQYLRCGMIFKIFLCRKKDHIASEGIRIGQLQDTLFSVDHKMCQIMNHTVTVNGQGSGDFMFHF